MNKASVDRDIPAAYEALKTSGVVQDGKIDSGFRGQIATFGAAVSMGSLLSAIAFFSEKDKSAVPREKLLDALFRVLQSHGMDRKYENLYQYAAAHPDCQEEVLNAAIALKLAINLYPKRDKDAQQERTP
ncbi:MAG: hypothetical protein IJK52_12895 [Oscillospiraceae bacterium]|nr:hypothetical protein [Oscillospiraceae bacterium]